MKKNHHDISRNKSKRIDLRMKHSQEQIKSHKAYIKFLKDRFGNSFYKKRNKTEAGCPYAPRVDNLIGSDPELKEVQDKYDHAYELTKENIGRYISGIKYLSGMTRRNYLKTMGLFLTSVAIPFATSSCSPPCTSFQEEEGQLGTPEPGSTDEASVAIVKGGSSIEADVRRAVDMAGGLDEIQVGESVLIKPNCVSANAKQAGSHSHMEDGPIATNPEVLRAVIKVVKERNNAPEKIFIADHGAYQADTLDIMIKWGVYDVAMEEGVNVMPWEQTDHTCYQSDKSEYLDYPVHISATLSGFDHLINVPVLKNHELNVYPKPTDQAQYSCCLKNFVGIVLPDDRLALGKNFHEYDLPRKVAELHLARPYRMLSGKPGITMNIVDATRIIVSGGPHNNLFREEMKVEHPAMIVASKDRVACDTVALAVLKYYGFNRLGACKDYIQTPVWDQKQIIHAGHIGIGINDPDRIEILDYGISEPEMAAIMKMWNHTEILSA